jgi:DNA-binding MarR family transcriptional regulator
MAGHLIRRLNQISGQVFQQRTEAAGFDLTPVQFAAMQVLQATPGIDQAQLAAAIAYDRATIGGVVQRLEKRGYVERIVSATDRRAREVSLTPAGQAVLEDALPIVEALQNDILPGLTEAERQQFLALAQKVVRAENANGP